MKIKSIIEKKMPRLLSDEAAENFLEDLSPYLHKGNFSKIKFEFEPKSEKVNFRLAPSLLKNIKQRAKKAKIPYQRYMRGLLEHAMAQEMR